MRQGIILLIVFFVIHFSIFAQQQISEAEIVQFNQGLRKEALEEIRKNKRLYSSLPRQFEVIIVPNCSVEPATVSARVLKGQMPQFTIDQSSGFIIIKDAKGNILRTGYKDGFIGFAPDIKASSADQADIRMIELVFSKYAKYPFFVSFSELTPNHVIGFLKGDSIYFIGSEMEIVSDFKKIATKENGSLQKYLENMELKYLKINALKSISSLEDAKQILRKDYIAYAEAFPTDTTKVLNLLLDEMARCCQVTNDQIVLIKEKITLQMKKHFLFPINASGVGFYGLDIAPCIKSILEKNQYSTYLDKRELNSWLSSRASDKIYLYLINEKKIPEDNIMNEFIKDVFKANVSEKRIDK